MVADFCDAVAAIAYPLPDRDDVSDDIYDEVSRSAHENRLSMVSEAHLAWEEGGVDPVLARLSDLRTRLLEIEQEIRLLLAYGREFTHPRPYRLHDLAAASGMSISGVRTAYDEAEIDEVSRRIGTRPTRSRPDPGGGAS